MRPFSMAATRAPTPTDEDAPAPPSSVPGRQETTPQVGGWECTCALTAVSCAGVTSDILKLQIDPQAALWLSGECVIVIGVRVQRPQEAVFQVTAFG